MIANNNQLENPTKPTPISLEIFRNLFTAIADGMGIVLGRTAFSPNIKERQDFSCAIFDASGRMIAQAAHVPVHLGSMPASVEAALRTFSFYPGDVVALNDPYMGGTHLPDITMIAPVFTDEKPRSLVGFSANRAHHADIGGMTPGSLPLSNELFQEGIIIPPIKIISRGRVNKEVIELLCRNSRTPADRKGDLAAQMASCGIGEAGLKRIVSRYGLVNTQLHVDAILDYSEKLTRSTISAIPDGIYVGKDFLEDDGFSPIKLPIVVSIRVIGDRIAVDFSGTSKQTNGCMNAPFAIATSAVLYVIHCMVGANMPANDGVRRPITITAPIGSIVNPLPPAAVSGGNVETSQRIVDVLLLALSDAVPNLIPAGSQGTMNNILVGGYDEIRGRPFAYYETIGGGMGARPDQDGLSGIHTHMTNTMTNTMNTPIEALELEYPFRVLRYSLRKGSGGSGEFRGGNGITRYGISWTIQSHHSIREKKNCPIWP